MAYEPTEWKSGDVVTSAKLNKIEGGIVGAEPVVVTATEYSVDDSTVLRLSATWKEIHDAVTAHKLVIIDSTLDRTGYDYFADSMLVLRTWVNEGETDYWVTALGVSLVSTDESAIYAFAADGENSYPISSW